MVTVPQLIESNHEATEQSFDNLFVPGLGEDVLWTGCFLCIVDVSEVGLV